MATIPLRGKMLEDLTDLPSPGTIEEILKSAVCASEVTCLGASNGCISHGRSYQTDKGKFFVKTNNFSTVREMFVGEQAGLEALLATKTVRCPQPVALLENPDGSGMTFIMEHLELEELGPKQSATLGEQLARLHLCNKEWKLLNEKNSSRIGKLSSDDASGKYGEYVGQFGFHVTTYGGLIKLENEWCDDWLTFFFRHRLKPQMDLLEANFGDREVLDLWPIVERNIPKCFKDMDVIPALLHADIHDENVGQTDSEPVVFDPNCFYGHAEFELSMSALFGGFAPEFSDAYYKIIPKVKCHLERYQVYTLYNLLNHWNHFGPEKKYRDPALEMLRIISKW